MVSVAVAADIGNPYQVRSFNVRFGESRVVLATFFDTCGAFYGKNQMMRLLEGKPEIMNFAARQSYAPCVVSRAQEEMRWGSVASLTCLTPIGIAERARVQMTCASAVHASIDTRCGTDDVDACVIAYSVTPLRR